MCSWSAGFAIVSYTKTYKNLCCTSLVENMVKKFFDSLWTLRTVALLNYVIVTLLSIVLYATTRHNILYSNHDNCACIPTYRYVRYIIYKRLLAKWYGRCVYMVYCAGDARQTAACWLVYNRYTHRTMTVRNIRCSNVYGNDSHKCPHQ